MDWLICTKKEDEVEQYSSKATREALWWFCEKNGVGIGRNASEAYRFLKQFIWTDSIKGDYGSVRFIADDNKLILRKDIWYYGLHDDHNDITSVFLAYVDGNEEINVGFNIDVKSAVWKLLEDDSELYRKEWFNQCGDVKVFIKERAAINPFDKTRKSPVFFINDIPGLPGDYILSVVEYSD